MNIKIFLYPYFYLFVYLKQFFKQANNPSFLPSSPFCDRLTLISMILYKHCNNATSWSFIGIIFSFIKTVKTAMDEWDAVDLDELEQLAMEFNVGTKKTLQQMKSKLRSGKITREELIEKMKKRLKPVLELRAHVAKARSAA